MADIADVLDAIYDFALAAVYPNSTGSPSVTGSQIDVSEGWPLAEDIDTAMKSTPPVALVTIFAPGISSDPGQVLDAPGIVVAPMHGMSAADNPDGSITLSGAPGVGEYVTFVLDGKAAYSVAAVSGDTAASMATKIAAAVAVGYPGTTASGATVTVEGFHALTVRIGASGKMGIKTHRQRDQVVVTIWAVDPATRTLIAKPIDQALKSNLTFNLPDTSRAILTYQRTLMVDAQQKLGEYRRDLVYLCQYDTISEYQAFEVTSVTISTLAPTSGGLPAPPLQPVT